MAFTKEFNDLLQNKRSIEEEMRKRIAEMVDKAKENFVEHFRPLFEKYPQVKGIRWTQYTPYFNDGDACEFSSHHEYAGLLIEDPDDNTELLDTDDEGWGKIDQNIVVEFQKHFPDFNDDEMEAFFGDHCQVTIYPDRCEVEDYDHD